MPEKPPHPGSQRKRAEQEASPGPRAAAEAPLTSRGFDLDAALLEYVMDSEPPPFELGSMPPPEILESMPPASRSKIASSSPPRAMHVERLNVTGIDAVGTASVKPPAPPAKSSTVRAKRAIRELGGTAPGAEAPLVQRLLAIGDECLPLLAGSFPGLLWFDRNLPHQKVPRGRDVGPLARAFVAFGERSAPHLLPLLASADPDVRFPASLVAADIGGPPLIAALGVLATDPDRGIRDATAASLASLDAETLRPVQKSLRAIVQDDTLARERRMFAVHALATLRDAAAVPTLTPLLSPFDTELHDLARRALLVLTGLEMEERAWRSWLVENQAKNRAEWLIESLEGAPPQNAQIAAKELSRMTGEPIDSSPAMLPKERRAAVKQARRWLKKQG